MRRHWLVFSVFSSMIVFFAFEATSAQFSTKIPKANKPKQQSARPASESSTERADEDSRHVASILEHRARQDRYLRGPFSPLAKIKGYRLASGGIVRIGSSVDVEVRLESSDVLSRHAEINTIESPFRVRAIHPGVFQTWNAKNELYDLSEMPLRPTYGFKMGRFTLHFDPTGRYLEVFDPQAAALRDFKGQKYFDVDKDYLVIGSVVPYEEPVPIQLVDSSGGTQSSWVYGMLAFTVRQEAATLELYRDRTGPLDAGERFTLIFRDATSGKETYPAARYLSIQAVEQGEVIVDFNLAYNPPCVYSPHYSCPFPRPRNTLSIPVRAGALWHRPTGR